MSKFIYREQLDVVTLPIQVEDLFYR